MGSLAKHKPRLTSIVVGAVATVLGAPPGFTQLLLSAVDLGFIGQEVLKTDPGGNLGKRLDALMKELGNDPDFPVLQTLFEDNQNNLQINLGEAIAALRDGRQETLTNAVAICLIESLVFDGHSETQRTKAHSLIRRVVPLVLETEGMRDRFTETALIDLIREIAKQSDSLKALLEELRAQRQDGVVLSRKLAETVGDIYVDLTFTSRMTDFTGRDEEKKRLAEFIDAEDALLWWQVSGPGGEGKSRIALDLIDRLDESWYGGFLSAERLAKTDWARVRFHEPTLIVLDYVAAPEKAAKLAEMLVTLRARQKNNLGDDVKPLGQPVRILVLEREPYYLGENRTGQKVRNWLSEQAAVAKTRPALLATVFGGAEGSGLHLNPMSADDLLLIANSWRAHRAQAPLTEDEAANLIKVLGPDPADGKRSRAWRPLFAMIFAEMVGKSGGKAVLGGMPTMSDLLDAVLEQEQREFWRNKEIPKQGAHLAILATMTGKLDLASLIDTLAPNHAEWNPEAAGEAARKAVLEFYKLEGDNVDDVIAEAWQILGRNVVPHPQAPAAQLEARSPDLLGEYMVLWLLRQTASKFDANDEMQRLSKIVNDAWLSDSTECFGFFRRLQEDFPGDETARSLRTVSMTEAVTGITRDMSLSFIAALGLSGFLSTLLKKPSGHRIKKSEKDFALRQAAQEGHAEVVKILLDAGVKPKFIPLIQAAENGHAEVVKILLDAKAKEKEPDWANSIMSIVISSAVKNGHAEAVKILLTTGAMPDRLDPRDGLFPLIQAAQEGHAEVVKMLIDAGEKPDRVHEKTGTFPLLIAAHQGHTQVVEILIEAKAKPDQVNEKDGLFPLLIAAQEGHAEVVKILLDAKAKPDQVNEKDGLFPLLIAAQEGHAEVVKILLDAKAKPDRVHEKTGTFPLGIAAEIGHTEVVEMLLKAGEKPDRVNEKDGFFPLLLAALNGHDEVVKILLTAGEKPDRIDEKTGAFPLLIAAHQGHTEMVKILLDAKAKPDQVNPIDGTFPLGIAAQNGHTEMVKILLDAKAKPDQVNPIDGTFPLGIAAEIGHTEMVKILLDAKAKPDQVDPIDGDFSLLIAAEIGHTEMVKILLDAKGQKPDQVDPIDGDFSLLIAAQNGHAEVVERLIDAGEKPDRVNEKDGAFPLLVAAQNGHDGVVKRLIEAKAQPDQFHQPTGMSPLAVSILQDHIPVAEQLLKAGADMHHAVPEMGTAMDIARAKENEKMIRMLEQCMA